MQLLASVSISLKRELETTAYLDDYYWNEKHLLSPFPHPVGIFGTLPRFLNVDTVLCFLKEADSTQPKYYLRADCLGYN